MTQKINKEAKIIDAAYKLFLEKGFRSTTMDDICQSLGISKKTLYRFFSSKTELLAAAFQKLKIRMTAKVEATSWIIATSLFPQAEIQSFGHRKLFGPDQS